MSRRMTRIGLSAALLAAALIAAPSGFGLSAAQAAEEKQRPQKPQTRRSEVLGKAAFQLIEKAQEALAEEQFETALKALAQIKAGDRFKPYEKAVALQTEGFVHAGKGDYAATMASFGQAIASGHLPPRVVNDLTYNLAQINLAEGNAAAARRLLDTWFAAQEKEPGAAPFALMAQIALQQEDLPAAETAIRKALSKADAPKQNWTRILLSVLLQQERYAEARPVLEDAVVRWPGVKAFWQQLTAAAYETDDEGLAFVAQQALHVQGMLVSSAELSAMAQLYLYHNVPIKAAKLLADGMAAGTVDKSEKNYELLSQAYMHAREWKQAIAPLTRAAELSDKGKFYQQLAQSHLQDEAWAKAEAALVKALDKGVEDAADSWLLLGIARTRQDKFESAITAFRKAGEDDDLAKDAYRWIRSIEQKLKAARAG